MFDQPLVSLSDTCRFETIPRMKELGHKTSTSCCPVPRARTGPRARVQHSCLTKGYRSECACFVEQGPTQYRSIITAPPLCNLRWCEIYTYIHIYIYVFVKQLLIRLVLCQLHNSPAATFRLQLLGLMALEQSLSQAWQMFDGHLLTCSVLQQTCSTASQ